MQTEPRNKELVRDVICNEGKRNGYNVAEIQLTASDFGVPQARVRVFFIGIRNDMTFNIRELTPYPTQLKKVTIREALSDLPQIGAGEGSEGMSYPVPPQNDYQRWCRQDNDTVMNHVAMRHSERIIERFKCIKYGQSLADVPMEHMQRKRGDAVKNKWKGICPEQYAPLA